MQQMYDIVSDVDRYKEFVPWCTNSSVSSRRRGQAKAHLVIGFPPLAETYTSTMTLSRPNLVRVSLFIMSFKFSFDIYFVILSIFNCIGLRSSVELIANSRFHFIAYLLDMHYHLSRSSHIKMVIKHETICNP